MTDFTQHTLETAPPETVAALERVQEQYRFIPNLYLRLAEAPTALEAYLSLSGLFGKTTFSPGEQQLILIAISVENGCKYCVAAHSSGAKMAGLPNDVITALREGKPIDEPKLEALRQFCEAVVIERGWVEDRLGAFLQAGYSKQNVLEVMLAVAMKTLSNYSNHVLGTPLDEVLSKMAWDGKQSAA